MPRPSARSREELRALVLREAQRIVSREGLAGLTTRKIAGAVGYAVGSLYLAFANQDDIILHLNAGTLDDLYAVLGAPSAGPPQARIVALGHAYLDFAGAHSRRWQAVFDYRHPDGGSLPDWYQDKIVRLFRLVETPLQELLPHASPTQISQAARALWGGVHGICTLAFSGKLDVVGAPVQEVLDNLMCNYLAGLKLRACEQIAF